MYTNCVHSKISLSTSYHSLSMYKCGLNWDLKNTLPLHVSNSRPIICPYTVHRTPSTCNGENKLDTFNCIITQHMTHKNTCTHAHARGKGVSYTPGHPPSPLPHTHYEETQRPDVCQHAETMHTCAYYWLTVHFMWANGSIIKNADNWKHTHTPSTHP